MSTDKIPEILEVKATILSENTAGPLPVLAEWGLSTLVETKFENGHVLTILLDTGTTGDVLLHNAEVLDVNLSAIFFNRSPGPVDFRGGHIALGIRPVDHHKNHRRQNNDNPD